MYLAKKQNHHIDIIFILALFFLFAFSSIILIILGSNVYQKTATQMESHFDQRSVSSYITEKIRQNDVYDTIVISSLGSVEALQMDQIINGTSYSTYLYVYEKHLYELFAQSDIEMQPSDGQEILPLEDINFSFLTSNLLEITYHDTNNIKKILFVSLHTAQ